MNIPRLIRTVRHLRAAQVFWRARYIAEHRLGLTRAPKPPHAVPTFDPHVLARLSALLERWRALDERAHKEADLFRRGQFRFLNATVDFASGVDWTSGARPRLWRYQLHYFDGAKTLAIAGAPDDAELVCRWQRDWIVSSPLGADVAWDAFTISSRLLNWALAAATWGAPDDKTRQSYLLQARYLATHLERDVQGNHLLKNACALAVASALAWPEGRILALAQLREALGEQILADGGHFERSPMYHGLILEDLIVVEAALGTEGAFLRPVIEKMAWFLAQILHPDGEIPFFGDAVLGEARRPAVLLALAGLAPDFAPDSVALEPSGYYTLRLPHAGLEMIVRGGPAGPAHQLGHAHGDLFSFELSVNGQRALVNSGTHGYADSPHRVWCRSEAAHNGIDVAGDPQLEAWGAFRVGARHGVPAVHYAADEAFRGTAVLPNGTTIERVIKVDRDQLLFEDSAIDRRAIDAIETVARLHLAPGLTWVAQGETWGVKGADLRVHIMAGKAHTEPGWYFPEFGVEQANEVLVLRNTDALRYSITRHRQS